MTLGIWTVQHYIDDAFWESVWTSDQITDGAEAICRAQLDRSDGTRARARPVEYRVPRARVIYTAGTDCDVCGAKTHSHCEVLTNA